MAFETFEFSKSWKNPEDFPAYEPDEHQVRADLQLLHDEARDAINRLIASLSDPSAADNIPIRVEGLEAENVRQAVEQVYAAVRDAAAGLIVDGSVTKEKLEADLLERIYGGRVWISLNEPTEEQNPHTDFPVGQLWLRPGVTIENLAKEQWEVVGGSAVEDGFITDGSRDYLTASQLLQSVGKPGEQIIVCVRSEAPENMSLFLNGIEYDTEEAVFETQLDRTGSLEIMIRGQWDEAVKGEELSLTCLTAVNTDGLCDPAWESCRDWGALLGNLGSFTEHTLPQTLWVQVRSGVWEKAAVRTGSIPKGALLCGDGTDQPQALLPKDGILRMEGGSPVWESADAFAVREGLLRTVEGSYEGTGGNDDRVLTLPVAPKVLYICPEDGSYDTVALVNGGRSSDTYSLIDGNLVVNYLAQVRLDGSTLRFTNERRGNYGSQMLTQHMNAEGVTYRYMAVC